MHTRVARVVIVLASIAVFVAMGSALAQETTDVDVGQDRLIAEGRVVYEASCQGCHQADGRGTDSFPALLGNTAIDDSVYLEAVIRQGEAAVANPSFDGSMPDFAFLSDDQIAALIAYLQEGLDAPAPPPAPPTTPTTTSPGLPIATVLAYTAGFGIFAVAAVVVGGPIALARRRERTFTTVQVWLKVVAIVVYFTLATVFIPSWVVESRFLASPPSVYEDLFSAEFWGLVRDGIGTAVWLAALLGGLWALRSAQRRDVI